jgi:hypothetical protein
MAKLFNRKKSLPNNDELITSLLIAIQFLNPEHTKEEVLCGVLDLLTGVADRNKLLLLTDDVCKSASDKFDEVQSLYEQFQLTTDINN